MRTLQTPYLSFDILLQHNQKHRSPGHHYLRDLQVQGSRWTTFAGRAILHRSIKIKISRKKKSFCSKNLKNKKQFCWNFHFTKKNDKNYLDVLFDIGNHESVSVNISITQEQGACFFHFFRQVARFDVVYALRFSPI